MVDSKDKNNCCGCRACEHICPKNAIQMNEDIKGFKYPKIDHSLCNKCGLCDTICAFNNNYRNHGDNPTVYAVKNKDENIRATSTSGGMFVAISDEIIKNGGVVYGVNYGEKLYVCHQRAETKEQRDQFKGSKYIQSDLGDTFLKVKQDLEDDRMVLFTGTPCQVASLNNFLKKDFENLLTVDIICHGTPSNKIWREYLDIIEKINKIEIIYVNFRDKSIGWHQPKVKIESLNKSKKEIIGEKSFFQLFVKNYILMPACYNCYFANFKRPGDITIGDFWGIERTMSEFDDNKGVSLVMVNSKKGNLFIDKIKDNIEMQISSKENCMHGTLQCASPKNKDTDKLWNDYEKYGLRYIIFKYTDYSNLRTFIKKVINKIKSLLNLN